MKNKIFYCVFLIIFPSLVLSNEFEFNASEIESYNNGNMIKGFGGVPVARELNIKQPKFEERSDLSNIKFEVAKGLADPINDRGLYKLKSNHKPLEVIGEEGFSIRTNGIKTIFQTIW